MSQALVARVRPNSLRVALVLRACYGRGAWVADVLVDGVTFPYEAGGAASDQRVSPHTL